MCRSVVLLGQPVSAASQCKRCIVAGLNEVQPLSSFSLADEADGSRPGHFDKVLILDRLMIFDSMYIIARFRSILLA